MKNDMYFNNLKVKMAAVVLLSICSLGVLGINSAYAAQAPAEVVIAAGGQERLLRKYNLSGVGVSTEYGDKTSVEAEAVLESVGHDLKGAFDWSKKLHFCEFASDPEIGTEWFAEYGFRKNEGNDYVISATFCKMARMLGYDARQMDGIVRAKSGKALQHSWVEITEKDGTVNVYDPGFEAETGRSGFAFSYGDEGTFKYEDKHQMNG